MDLRQLSYVVAVVDEGGMTRAAAAIGVAQPTLSQAIRSLEAELGVELFHRVGRTVQLSAAGAALVAPARAALRDAATARAAVAAVAGLEAGHLDLVSLPTLAVHPLAELIGRFRAAHPAVTVRLHEPDDPAAVQRQVREGAAELGCTELPVAEDLVTVPLAEQEYVALVPSDRRSTVGRSPSVTMTDLARLPFITTPVGTSARRQLDERLAAAGVVATVAVETDHREAIAPLVRAGAGVAIVPGDVAAAARGAGADVVPLRPRLVRRVGLVHRDGPLSPAAHRLVQLAVGDGRGRRRPRPRRR